MEYLNFPPSENTLTTTCSEGASANHLLLWRRRMLITSGATGGKDRPLNLSAPKELNNIDYGNVSPIDNLPPD